jgi:hypothetical protein
VSPEPQNWRHPLVFVVAGVLVCGVAAAVWIADARSPSYALGSEFVYRVEIGAVTVVALLFCLTALRLASYGRTFTQFGAGPGQIGAGREDPATALDDASVQIERAAEQLRAEIGEIRTYVRELGERVEALEAADSPPSSRLVPGQDR